MSGLGDRACDADAVVIGAGIVGTACAMELSRAGLDVIVLERSFPGAGATGAGMGHIVVMDDSDAEFALTRLSRDLWEALAPELPEAAERRACGTLWAAADDEEMAAVHAKAAWYAARNVNVEVLDGAAVRRSEPNLRQGLAGGLKVPADSVVYQPVVAAWMLDQAVARGARLIRSVDVARIVARAALSSDGRAWRAPVIVNACGAWSPELTPGLPVRPRKGHLVITDRCPGFCNSQIVELGYLKSAHSHAGFSVAFNIQPRATGQVLIGSSRQYNVGTRDIEWHVLERMLSRAEEYMPGIGQLRAIRAWTGFRPATPDSLPLIGPVDAAPGLWLATGHEGLGITTSLGTARVLCDLILGRTPPIDPAPYSPSRIAGIGLGDGVAA